MSSVLKCKNEWMMRVKSRGFDEDIGSGLARLQIIEGDVISRRAKSGEMPVGVYGGDLCFLEVAHPSSNGMHIHLFIFPVDSPGDAHHTVVDGVVASA
jgi:hypothetical protein